MDEAPESVSTESGSESDCDQQTKVASYKSKPRRKATQRPVGSDQKRQAFSKRKRGLVLKSYQLYKLTDAKVFVFVVNDKGSSWAYASPGFGASLAPSHLKELRTYANVSCVPKALTEVMPHPSKDTEHSLDDRHVYVNSDADNLPVSRIEVKSEPKDSSLDARHALTAQAAVDRESAEIRGKMRAVAMSPGPRRLASADGVLTPSGRRLAASVGICLPQCEYQSLASSPMDSDEITDADNVADMPWQVKVETDARNVEAVRTDIARKASTTSMSVDNVRLPAAAELPVVTGPSVHELWHQGSLAAAAQSRAAAAAAATQVRCQGSFDSAVLVEALMRHSAAAAQSVPSIVSDAMSVPNTVALVPIALENTRTSTLPVPVSAMPFFGMNLPQLLLVPTVAPDERQTRNKI